MAEIDEAAFKAARTRATELGWALLDVGHPDDFREILAAYLDALRAVLAEEAEDDEPEVWSTWIEWSGGECPLPDDVETQIELRGGTVRRTRPAKRWFWKHLGLSTDIVRFRYCCQPGGWVDAPPRRYYEVAGLFDVELRGAPYSQQMRLVPRPAKPELPEWITKRPGHPGLIRLYLCNQPRNFSRGEITRIAEAHRILTERGE